jgi:cytochrome b subunit of formate dehydrogenase
VWDFRLIIGMVFAVILLTGGGLIWLAASGLGGQTIDTAQSVLAHAFTAAVGALLGLVGARSTS